MYKESIIGQLNSLAKNGKKFYQTDQILKILDNMTWYGNVSFFH